jgi:hypothetical protein
MSVIHKWFDRKIIQTLQTGSNRIKNKNSNEIVRYTGARNNIFRHTYGYTSWMRCRSRKIASALYKFMYTYKVGGAYIKGVSTQINIQDVTRLRTSATATDVGVWQMAGSTFHHSPICSCSTLKYNGIFILFMGLDRRDLPMNNRSSRGIYNEQFDIKNKIEFIYE